MPKLKHMTLIAIAGGSGSGKSTLAKALMDRLGPQKCSILAQDHYYVDQSDRFDEDGGSVNFDHPDSIDFKLISRHFELLRQTSPIEVPSYDFTTHTRAPETHVFHPTPYIIFEGTLVLLHENIRRYFDRSFFVHTSEELRFQRRLHRDVEERGREPEGVKRQFLRQVKPMHDQFVEPTKHYADYIASGTRSPQDTLEHILNLLP